MRVPVTKSPPEEPTQLPKRMPGRPLKTPGKRLLRLSISLTEAQRKVLIEQAYASGQSLSELIRGLLFPSERKTSTESTKPGEPIVRG